MSCMKILLVDDEEPILEIITSMLAHSGHEVKSALNGTEALRLYRQCGPFDFVLTGLEMPELNGIDLMKKVLSENSQQRFGFMTSYPVLQRPFEVDQLLTFVAR